MCPRPRGVKWTHSFSGLSPGPGPKIWPLMPACFVKKKMELLVSHDLFLTKFTYRGQFFPLEETFSQILRGNGEPDNYSVHKPSFLADFASLGT